MRRTRWLSIFLLMLSVVVAQQEATSTAALSEETSATTTKEEEEAEEASGASNSNPTKPTNTTDATPSGPFIDLFGPQLLQLEMVDETSAQLVPHDTNDALQDASVVGVYFSADWCGPCQKFTPELVSFYQRMNTKRRAKFEIVWVSRCRDVNAYGQFLAKMGPWYALPPQLAMGEWGQALSNKYGVKGIPSLVLLDEMGNVITTDARNKIPQDKAGVGFPWRNPIVTLYRSLVPRGLRVLIRSQVTNLQDKVRSKRQAAAAA